MRRRQGRRNLFGCREVLAKKCGHGVLVPAPIIVRWPGDRCRIVRMETNTRLYSHARSGCRWDCGVLGDWGLVFAIKLKSERPPESCERPFGSIGFCSLESGIVRFTG